MIPRAIGAVVAAVLLLRCGTGAACGGERVDRSVLVRRVMTPAQIRSEYLAELEGDSLPEEGRRAVEELIDGESALLTERMQPGDQIWYYKYEKCPGCGWYRAGYYLLRGPCIVKEINTRDDM